MKSPIMLDRFLRERGFGYGKPYYQRLHSHLPLIECVHLGRHSPGLLTHLKVVYIDRDGGPQISPLELDVLYADGRVSGQPGLSERDAFWDFDDVDPIIEALASVGMLQLERLTNPGLMLEVYEFLMHGPSEATCLSIFPELSQPWVVRGTTPLRLMSQAAYLNLLGRFNEAATVLSQLRELSEFDLKILGDAEARQVRYVAESLAYLEGIGAASQGATVSSVPGISTSTDF